MSWLRLWSRMILKNKKNEPLKHHRNMGYSFAKNRYIIKNVAKQYLDFFSMRFLREMCKMHPKYVQCISIPRSGHHLLVSFLFKYFSMKKKYENFEYCNKYNTCKTCPCSCENGNVVFQKNHDLGPSFPDVEYDRKMRYIFQYRKDIVSQIISNFKLIYEKRSKKELETLDTREHWEKAALNGVKYYNRVIEKWYIDKKPNVHLIAYEDLVLNPNMEILKALSFFIDKGDIDKDLISKIVEKQNIEFKNKKEDFKYYNKDFCERLYEMSIYRDFFLENEKDINIIQTKRRK